MIFYLRVFYCRNRQLCCLPENQLKVLLLCKDKVLFICRTSDLSFCCHIYSLCPLFIAKHAKYQLRSLCVSSVSFSFQPVGRLYEDAMQQLNAIAGFQRTHMEIACSILREKVSFWYIRKFSCVELSFPSAFSFSMHSFFPVVEKRVGRSFSSLHSVCCLWIIMISVFVRSNVGKSSLKSLLHLPNGNGRCVFVLEPSGDNRSYRVILLSFILSAFENPIRFVCLSRLEFFWWTLLLSFSAGPIERRSTWFESSSCWKGQLEKVSLHLLPVLYCGLVLWGWVIFYWAMFYHRFSSTLNQSCRTIPSCIQNSVQQYARLLYDGVVSLKMPFWLICFSFLVVQHISRTFKFNVIHSVGVPMFIYFHWLQWLEASLEFGEGCYHGRTMCWAPYLVGAQELESESFM